MKSGMGRYVLLLPRDEGKNLGGIGGSFRSSKSREEELGEKKCYNRLGYSEDGRIEGLTRRFLISLGIMSCEVTHLIGSCRASPNIVEETQRPQNYPSYESYHKSMSKESGNISYY